MSKLYNKIELIGQWDYLQSILSRERKNPDELVKEIIKPSFMEFCGHLVESMLYYMETDKLTDLYLYKFEFQVIRQKQEPKDIPSNDRSQENDERR